MSYDIALVSSGYDMTIRFWSEISSGTQCKYTVEHKDNAINALEMTPAKDKVAFASGNSIKFLDLHKLSPNPVLSIDSHEGLLSTILFPELLKDLVKSGIPLKKKKTFNLEWENVEKTEDEKNNNELDNNRNVSNARNKKKCC